MDHAKLPSIANASLPAKYFRNRLKGLADYTKEHDPQDILDGSTAEEFEDIRRYIQIIEQFNDRLMAKGRHRHRPIHPGFRMVRCVRE